MNPKVRDDTAIYVGYLNSLYCFYMRIQVPLRRGIFSSSHFLFSLQLRTGRPSNLNLLKSRSFLDPLLGLEILLGFCSVFSLIL